MSTRKLDTKGRRLIQVRLDAQLAKDIRIFAALWEMSRQDTIDRLLREALGPHLSARNAEEGQRFIHG